MTSFNCFIFSSFNAIFWNCSRVIDILLYSELSSSLLSSPPKLLLLLLLLLSLPSSLLSSSSLFLLFLSLFLLFLFLGSILILFVFIFEFEFEFELFLSFFNLLGLYSFIFSNPSIIFFCLCSSLLWKISSIFLYFISHSAFFFSYSVIVLFNC